MVLAFSTRPIHFECLAYIRRSDQGVIAFTAHIEEVESTVASRLNVETVETVETVECRKYRNRAQRTY